MHRNLANLLVIIPHSRTRIPPEIAKRNLSDFVQDLINVETDWYTHRLYDFREILHNQQIIFPMCQIFVNACRYPDRIHECVPISINKVRIYRKNMSLNSRKEMAEKYLTPFHAKIEKTKKSLIFEGHSTFTGHKDKSGRMVAGDILLEDIQFTPDGKKIRFAEEGIMDFYAEQLKKHLPHLRIFKNMYYLKTYDYIGPRHGIEGSVDEEKRVPILLQETNEELYLIKSGKRISFDKKKLEKLRRAFALSLLATMQEFSLAR